MKASTSLGAAAGTRCGSIHGRKRRLLVKLGRGNSGGDGGGKSSIVWGVSEMNLSQKLIGLTLKCLYYPYLFSRYFRECVGLFIGPGFSDFFFFFSFFPFLIAK